jgi:hypothetical protein
MMRDAILATVLLAPAVVGLAAGPALAQSPSNAELAQLITAARQENQMEMRDYAWTSRTEIKVKNETKVLKTETVRYTADGELQRTILSEKESDAPKRGVKGKVAKKKIKGMKEWAAGLMALLQQYSLPTSGNVLDFLEKASVEPGDEPGIVRVSARAVVQQGDSVDWWVDTQGGGLQRTRVVTELEGDLVELTTQHKMLDTGLSYVAQQMVQVPDQDLEMIVENFSYDRQ